MAKGLVFILGSLRQGSNSPKVAAAVEVLFSEDMIVKEIPIADLPLYHLDLDEGDVPESYTRFCQAVKEQDYHSRISLQLTRSNENTIDMGSRPLGDDVFDGKPNLIVSHSTGNVLGFGANHQLRQSLVFLNVPVLAQPECYLVQAG
ncbi:flavin reductase [Streptococcus canis]|uniref:NADPH-dependent FMN reductase n=1 Tax=Streptococcus canis TaxID=1329 RepID=UPI0012EFBF18|nr:NADPH-dependent FMN reductase [Streptococcus canis]GFE43214.1 flavin reductase [Streptococcus canis]GFE47523.1 flavin reductase [Streptococcus canis]GFG43284.1 flavin reductase [Streptococcus canis]GFG45815.1 flavin reductase [Streptococcus canis]